jgi:hypothetical protein
MTTKEWGNLTWKLFHTLAAQIQEQDFFRVKDQLIDVVITTCHHLPCPTCTKDAMSITKQAKIQDIQTKEDFIEFVRQLHNVVNIKLNKKIYSQDEIKNMYNTIHLDKLMTSFIIVYNKTYGNMKMMTHNYHKQQFITLLVPKFKFLINFCAHN